MDQIPITEFFDDEPLLTPAKMHAGKNLVWNKKITTAICTFLCENLDQAALQPILQDCRLLYYVYGRSGKVPIFQYKEQCLIVLLTVGSPVAVGVVEELKYLGIQNIIAFGTAGLLDAKIGQDTFILIEKAIRDEGASYHYCPPSLYIETDSQLTDWVEKFLTGKAPTQRGITWTTDGFFRETSQRKDKRLTQGAVVVEMECAGFAAACQKLKIRFAEFVFFSDTLTAPAGWAWCGDKTQQDARRTLKSQLLQALSAECLEINLPKIK